MKFPVDAIKEIAVFRALQLGDMLCAIPAVKALKNAYPNANITLIGLPWAKTLTDRFKNYFSDFISFPGYPGLPEQPLDPAAFTEFLGSVQQRKFDLALQMQGNGSLVNPMVELFGARYTAGFAKEGHYAPDNGLFMPYPDYGHEIHRHLALLNFLNIPSNGNDLEYPLYQKDHDDYEELNLALTPKRYVCIHPGSRGSWRQWPVKHFAALADYCAEQGYEVVLTGTKDEEEIVNAVIGYMQHMAINTAGRTSMGAVGVLIKNAALLISNCTGVSHIASAFKTRSVVISMDGEPERWGPLDQQIHRTINWLKTPDFHLVFHETVDLLNQRH